MLALPPRPLLDRFLGRAVLLWALLRGGLAAVGWLAGVAPIKELIFIDVLAAGLVVVLTAGLTLMDARRRGEALLLANLAIPRVVLIALAAGPALLGEVIIRTVGPP